jgi:hypothetical protein
MTRTDMRPATRLAKIRAQIAEPRDLLLAIRILAWAVTLRVLKYFVPLPTLVKAMRRLPAQSVRAIEREQQVIAFARWACRLTAWPARGNCLERALVSYRYLGPLGAEPVLFVGLGRDLDRSVRGHAWLVVDGQPVDETRDSLSDFKRVIAFGADGDQVPGVQLMNRCPMAGTE